ncbi:hypothetical protein ACFWZ3_15195 [Frateuria sp. GZRR35]|uniref:hypothetical protein n=1 Tax=unclassified Frateuria TaxID=2648894 RepID=UPI003EDC32C1
MKNIAILIFLAAFSQETIACPMDLPDPRADARNADNIEAGYVVADRWPDYERHLLSGKSGFVVPDRRIVRVVFTEVLKGRLTAPQEIVVPCSSPAPEARERVIVLHSQQYGYHLVPFLSPDYEKALRAALSQR